MNYKYVGKTQISLIGFGVIAPGQIITTDKVINNPLFKIVHNKKRST